MARSAGSAANGTAERHRVAPEGRRELITEDHMAGIPTAGLLRNRSQDDNWRSLYGPAVEEP